MLVTLWRSLVQSTWAGWYDLPHCCHLLIALILLSHLVCSETSVISSGSVLWYYRTKSNGAIGPCFIALYRWRGHMLVLILPQSATVWLFKTFAHHPLIFCRPTHLMISCATSDFFCWWEVHGSFFGSKTLLNFKVTFVVVFLFEFYYTILAKAIKHQSLQSADDEFLSFCVGLFAAGVKG